MNTQIDAIYLLFRIFYKEKGFNYSTVYINPVILYLLENTSRIQNWKFFKILERNVL